MRLLDQVATTLRRRIRLPRGARVVAAVSGGADSVALACLLAELAARGTLELAGIAHLNHQLRGADADDDEAFCAAMAARMSVPFRSARVDVAAAARARGESIEAAARHERYAWLAETAAELAATHIATGHTLDDQAETVLLRLLRGAGSRGLSGIRAARGAVIRPLIECRRADVRAYLSARDEPFREDASNLDVSIPRNLLRRDLLPVIDRVTPGGLEALARTAALAADDEDFLVAEAVIAARSVVLASADGVQLHRVPLKALAPAIARRVIRAAVEMAAPIDAPRLTSRHIEAVWRLVTSDSARHADLPGVRVEADQNVLRVNRAASDESHLAGDAPFELALGVPGTLTILEAGWIISAERGHQTAPAGVEPREALRIAVPAALVRGPLTVRNRRPGDRIKPIGAPGRKKVQDLLVDRKVPRAERDRVPVVVDADGRLMWVVGVAMADEFRVTAPEAEVVVFKAERQ
jgi:tRNA(Ile)-lysidine synthase